MRGNSISKVLLATFFAMQVAPAFACGESLFHLGKGVRYRAYAAPIPGTVLVFARTAKERAVAEQLRRAGHEVLLAENERGFAEQLQQQGVDVVVAPVDAQSATRTGAAGTISGIDWVPVYASAQNSAAAVGAGFGDGVRSDDDIRKYLKAIHHRLKDRRD